MTSTPTSSSWSEAMIFSRGRVNGMAARLLVAAYSAACFPLTWAYWAWTHKFRRERCRSLAGVASARSRGRIGSADGHAW